MAEKESLSSASLFDHLSELRVRIIRALIAVAVAVVVVFIFSRSILSLILRPLAVAAGRGEVEAQIVFTSPLEILFVRLDIAVWGGLAVAFPVVAREVYAFVSPGLYRRERLVVLPWLIAIPVLALAGLGLVYVGILPIIAHFAFSQGGLPVDGAASVSFLPRVRDYIDLSLTLAKAFVVAFQLPVVLGLAAMAGLVNAPMLRRGRKYALVAIFAAAMLLTPPDPFSQTALAVPVYLLYETGVLMVALVTRSRENRTLAQQDADNAGHDQNTDPA